MLENIKSIDLIAKQRHNKAKECLTKDVVLNKVRRSRQSSE